MVVLLRDVFDTVAFYIWFPYHVAPFAANDTEFTSAFMVFKVLLKHLCLTAKESALDCGILAFIHMSFEVVVWNNISAALLSIITASLDLSQLFSQEGMWVDKFECGRGTVWALDLVITLNELANVVIDTRLAKALSTLVAFSWVNHHVLAKTTVKQCVVFWLLRSWRIKTLSSINLGRSKRHSSFHYQWATCIVNIFGHKLGLHFSIFVDGIAAIAGETWVAITCVWLWILLIFHESWHAVFGIQ